MKKKMLIVMTLILLLSWSKDLVAGSQRAIACSSSVPPCSAIMCSERHPPRPHPTIVPREVPLPTGLVTLGPAEFSLGTGHGWHVEDEGLIFTQAGEWLSPLLSSREKYPFWGRLWLELDRSPNLIPNGNFETVEEGAPTGWRVYDLPGATLEVVEGDAAGGQRSLRFTLAETDEGGYLIRLEDFQPLEPGFYVLYAHFRCSAGFAETGSVYGSFALYRQQDQTWDWVWSTSTFVQACAAGSADTRTPLPRWQMGRVALVYVPDDGHAYGFKAGLWFGQFLGRPTTGTLEVDEFRLERVRPLWLAARSSLDGVTWTEWTPRYLLLQVGDHFLALPSLDGDEIWETAPRFEPRTNLLLPLAQGYPYVQLRLAAEAPLILRSLSFEHTPAAPFVIPWDDAEPAVVNDHPYAPQHDAPAGRHGFVVARDGHLYFQGTGERARFWGMQTHAGACFDDETNRLMIERLAKRGFNLIKVGGPAWYWWDEKKRDCYDRFFATMKERGIYGYIQLEPVPLIYAMAKWPEARAYITATYGTFPEWEWFIEGPAWPWHGPEFRVALFSGDEALTAFIENWFRDLLEHRNPYTGKRYLEEEAVALVEIGNENWLTASWYNGGLAYGALPTYYEDLFDQRWRAWLQKRYESFQALKAAWDDGTGQVFAPGETSFDTLRRHPDTMEDIRSLVYSDARTRDLTLFYHHLEQTYYEHMARFLKETLGVRQPVIASHTHTGRLFGETVVETSTLLDVNDIHRYYDHPRREDVPGLGRVRIWNKDPFHPTWGDAVFDAYGQFNLRGKPLTRSEVNWTWYNEHSYLFIPGLVAYSSLHDVDAVILFCYMWHHDCDNPWHHEGRIIHGSCGNLGTTFILHSNPIVLTQNVAAYVAFLRGDVAPSPSAIPLRYTEEGLERMIPTYLAHWWSSLLLENLRFGDRHVGLVRRVQKDYQADAPTLEPPWPDAPGGAYVSATGEITYDFGSRLFTVETPRFQAAAGKLAGRSVRMGDLEATVHHPTHAALMRVALTPGGDRSLLSVAARAANLGMVLSPSGEEPLAWGDRPVIAEVVSATVTWRTDMPSVRVYALDERGQRRAEIPVQKVPGGVTFVLGGKHRTLWYELATRTKTYLPVVCRIQRRNCRPKHP